jgi:diaminohydroxyphosphoribosylaminopyrimidine deaminase/5-amino-6-(5-phosphoribosylamino)uracil reductase
MPRNQERLDQQMMARALRIAAKGRPSPNPHVGAVIVRGERIIAHGFHSAAGRDHAEVMAIKRAGRAARGATLYVTFEPCNHHGRTPPCTEAILAAGLARVVIGCRDPAPHMPGAVERLREQGLSVTVGVRDTQAQRLVADFVKHFTTGLPFVTLKSALTLDGRMATRTGHSQWITGEKARRHAHRLRDRSDAILVGVGTVLADDPELTVRHVRGRTPLRAVLDTNLRTPPKARVLGARAEMATLLFHGPGATEQRKRRLLAAGAELIEVRATREGLSLKAVLRELGKREVVRLLVEGGPRIHGSLLSGRLADRAAIFLAPKILADPKAFPLAFGRPVLRMGQAIDLASPVLTRLGPDTLITGDLAYPRGR